MATGLTIFAVLIGGCGSEEELKPDEGVSPFFTGKRDAPDGTTEIRPVTKVNSQTPDPGTPSVAGAVGGDARKSPEPGSSGAPVPFTSFDDLDKLNKSALSLADKGSPVEAAKIFDQVLGAEPLNRTALFGRSVVGMQLLEGLSEQDQIVEIGLDAELMRTLKKNYKQLQPREQEALGGTIFNEAVILSNQGQAEKSLEVLKEAVDSGYRNWDQIKYSKAFESIRKEPIFKELVDRLRADASKSARVNSRFRLDQEVNFPFSFNLKSPDGKPLSSADLKGKVVLVDFWGTWCGPCRAMIPHLISMHRKYSDEGLVIVGIAREHAGPEKAIELVKQFVEDAGIPYACVMGDDETEARVPNFGGYPTTLLLDGTGKVRFRSIGAQQGEAQAIEDAAVVLLDELKSRSTAATPEKPKSSQE